MNYRLSRLPYAVSIIAYELWVMSVFDGEVTLEWLWVLLSLPLVLIFVIIPRLRDCGWPYWVGILTMIPVLGIVPGVTLLFAPSRSLFRDTQN